MAVFVVVSAGVESEGVSPSVWQKTSPSIPALSAHVGTSSRASDGGAWEYGDGG